MILMLNSRLTLMVEMKALLLKSMKIQTLYKSRKRVTIHMMNRNLTNHHLLMIKRMNRFLALKAMTTLTEEILFMVSNTVKV